MVEQENISYLKQNVQTMENVVLRKLSHLYMMGMMRTTWMMDQAMGMMKTTWMMDMTIRKLTMMVSYPKAWV